MVPLNNLLLFAGAALLMVLTPGPNMIYLISRSICQGRKAGVISLLGVILGFVVHMFAAALGITALFLAIPIAYDLLKWAGQPTCFISPGRLSGPVHDHLSKPGNCQQTHPRGCC